MGLRNRTFLAAGGVMIVAALVGGCGGGGSEAKAEDKTPESKTFALSGKKLTIDSDGSDIQLVPADVEDLEVTRWFSGRTALGESPRVTWDMKRDTLTLRTECDALISDCSARHEVKVPRGVAVVVEEDNGAVTASGFDTALTLRSDNGEVVVRDSSGALDLFSDNGQVVAEGVSGKSVRATSDNGAVRLRLTAVPDRVETSSDNGSVTIELPRAAATYKVTTESDNGQVDVDVPLDDTSRHVVEAHSDNGEITVRSVN
jgi:hypothetical protein